MLATYRSKVMVIQWCMAMDLCAIYDLPISKQTKVRSLTQRQKKPINLTLRSKVNVILKSWMYATHCIMVIHSCVKYGKPMSNPPTVLGWTQIYTDGLIPLCWTLGVILTIYTTKGRDRFHWAATPLRPYKVRNICNMT